MAQEEMVHKLSARKWRTNCQFLSTLIYCKNCWSSMCLILLIIPTTWRRTIEI